MPTTPEAIAADIAEAATAGFRGRLMPGQARAIIWRDGVLPPDAPQVSTHSVTTCIPMAMPCWGLVCGCANWEATRPRRAQRSHNGDRAGTRPQRRPERWIATSSSSWRRLAIISRTFPREPTPCSPSWKRTRISHRCRALALLMRKITGLRLAVFDSVYQARKRRADHRHDSGASRSG